MHRRTSFEGRVDQQLFEDRVFGTDSGKAPAYVLVSPAGERVVVLQAGQVQGLTEGSTFRVFGTRWVALPQTAMRVYCGAHLD